MMKTTQCQTSTRSRRNIFQILTQWWRLTSILASRHSSTSKSTLRSKRSRTRKRSRPKMQLTSQSNRLKLPLPVISPNLNSHSWETLCARSFGLKSLFGSLQARITWLSEGGMLNRMRPSWRSTWTHRTCSCTQSSMEHQSVSSRTPQVMPSHNCLSMKLRLLICVSQSHGNTRCLIPSIGCLLIKCRKHHLLVCSFRPVVSLFGENATL